MTELPFDDKTTEIEEDWLVPGAPVEQGVAASLGSYRLCYELASGGMATVYLALYRGGLGFEKVVALKKIHPHLTHKKELLDMFVGEARLAARIDHPYVCRVVDFGRAEDSYFLAMEYLLGEPLSHVFMALAGNLRLATAPRRPFLVARLMADVAEGLHAAHELSDGDELLGLVHRDVNPTNLFVLYDGTVRILDFGIAKVKNRTQDTEPGKVRGTYAYVSPEQLRLEKVDRRADVWSLGIVCWEMFTGRRLFKRASPVETINATATGSIEPPSHVRPDIPAALDEVVLRALERNPDARYPNARAFADALESFIAGHGGHVPRSEVCMWLGDLFPGGASRKRELIERACTQAGQLRLAGNRKEEGREEVGPAPVPLASPSAGEARPDDGPEAEKPPPLGRSTGDKPASRPGRWFPLLFLGGAAAVVIGAVAVWGAPPLVPERGLETGGAPSAVDTAESAAAAEPPLYEHREPPSDDPVSEQKGEGSPDGLEWRKVGTRSPAADEPTRRAGRSNDEGKQEGMGSVHVTTQGTWAEIRVAGKSYGRTPETVHLPPGHHRVYLYAEGRPEPRVLDVDVREGRQVVLSVTLK